MMEAKTVQVPTIILCKFESEYRDWTVSFSKHKNHSNCRTNGCVKQTTLGKGSFFLSLPFYFYYALFFLGLASNSVPFGLCIYSKESLISLACIWAFYIFTPPYINLTSYGGYLVLIVRFSNSDDTTASIDDSPAAHVASVLSNRIFTYKQTILGKWRKIHPR